MSRIFISAAHKSSGKTTISIGLCAALKQMGKTVQAFKKGPDYIDPQWLGQASGRSCINLDFYTMEKSEILGKFNQYSKDADITIIEGNKGLYDGLDLDGSNSNAALAKLTKTPVILVLDARGMTRGIAPLILGYQSFDNDINIAGVILNQLGGFRHEDKLRKVIEHYTDAQVVGAVHKNRSFEIDERHLGLIPSNEDSFSEKKIESIKKTIIPQIDLDKLIAIAGATEKLDLVTPVINATRNQPEIKLGIVRNEAFGFYYPDDLEALEQAGARLINVDTLNDSSLPDIDALFIGGGFPETHMEQLESNKAMRQSIYNAIENDMPVYAECGGLMYLAKSIKWENKQHEMVGIIPGDIIMEKTPQGRGYVQLQETANSPWPSRIEHTIAAHEFHYSRFENLDKNVRFSFDVKRGTGIIDHKDGLVYRNLLACYTHQRHSNQNPWATRFIEFIHRTINNH